MADNKNSREAQARTADNRQRTRAVAEERDRWHETEPPRRDDEANPLGSRLKSVKFPATGSHLVARVGDQEIPSDTGNYRLAELVPATDTDRFDSSAAVRAHVQHPTVAAAMKRVIEASTTLANEEFPWSQRKAYETTFQALEVIDDDDHDDGIRAISDWIIECIRTKNRLPSSREVRRQAAKFCRANGYQIRTDEWLAI